MEQRNVNRRAVGASYEKLAGDYLRQQGYEILACNFRCRQGEIDIVAKEKGTLVFVEVKYRSSMAKGSPLEAVDAKKQRLISKTAAYYCYRYGYGENYPCRFDVVAVCGNEIVLVKNAFEYQGW